MNLLQSIIVFCGFLATFFSENVIGKNDVELPIQLPVIPQPNQVKFLNGTYSPDKDVRTVFEMPDSIRQQLMSYIAEAKDNTLFMQQQKDKQQFYDFLLKSEKRKKGKTGIRLVVEEDPKRTAEEYRLLINEDSIRLEASDASGIFYGLQTLLQLAGNTGNRLTLPTVDIVDRPRFAYRGVMIDISRHYFDKEFLKKQIDVLAHYKINRLHLHLTDAAGWRIQIDRYPRLTSRAAWRPETRWKDWWNGHRYYATETTSGAYGGYLTKNDARELVEYAQKRAITIVPEIEMPSHSEEVLAVYPELSCSHQPYGPSDFCIGNDKTFCFLEQVLTEIMEIFPSEYIHIGGDEAPKTAWKSCLLCQRRIREEGLNGVDGLQSYLIHRIERFLNAHNRKLLGWDEILDGGLAPNATVMSWRGTEGGLAAIRSGHRAIMTPGAYCYLDSYQDAPNTQPEAIGGYLPLQKVYDYNPVPENLEDSLRHLVYGVQANLWTEYIPTPEHAEYMLYPRVLAIAETGWTQPERKSWNNFHKQALKAVDRMQKSDYHPFDLAKEFGNRPETNGICLHKAYKKPVLYKAPYWRTYPADGEKALTDGHRGGWSYNDGNWQGFVSARRLDVVIDLEKKDTIQTIEADFMQICGPGVFLPEQICITTSEDGQHFVPLISWTNQVVKDDTLTIKRFTWTGKKTARYIRYQAKASPKYGGVIFTDEIVIK